MIVEFRDSKQKVLAEYNIDALPRVGDEVQLLCGRFTVAAVVWVALITERMIAVVVTNEAVGEKGDGRV